MAKDFTLAGVAFTRVPKGQESAVLVKQSLRVGRASGVESFNSGTRFIGRLVQDGNAPIVMEAELANSISPQQGDGVGFDPNASGGGYIHFIAQASYKFTVVTPGRYVLWERLSAPHKGGWGMPSRSMGANTIRSPMARLARITGGFGTKHTSAN